MVGEVVREVAIEIEGQPLARPPGEEVQQLAFEFTRKRIELKNFVIHAKQKFACPLQIRWCSKEFKAGLHGLQVPLGSISDSTHCRFVQRRNWHSTNQARIVVTLAGVTECEGVGDGRIA